MNVQQPRPKPGFAAALVACGLAVLGILTPVIGLLFVLVAALVALVASIRALGGACLPAIGFALLAWLLVGLGCLTSPLLLATAASVLEQETGALSRWADQQTRR